MPACALKRVRRSQHCTVNHGDLPTVLNLCNNALKLDPPLQLEEIEVSHRTGKRDPPAAPPPGADAAPTPRPRAVLVRFVSRRSKAHVMAAKKHLKGIGRTEDFPHPVFITDDLTQRRSKLAYTARGLKRGSKIDDTWVFDCRILIKDKFGIIHQINKEDDLKKYE